MHHRAPWLTVLALLASGAAAPAAPPDAADLAARIDRHLAAGWEKAGVKPAAAPDTAAPAAQGAGPAADAAKPN